MSSRMFTNKLFQNYIKLLSCRRRIFRSPQGSKNAKRGAYTWYVSTERFEADTAVGEKDKSTYSKF